MRRTYLQQFLFASNLGAAFVHSKEFRLDFFANNSLVFPNWRQLLDKGDFHVFATLNLKPLQNDARGDLNNNSWFLAWQEKQKKMS